MNNIIKANNTANRQTRSGKAQKTAKVKSAKNRVFTCVPKEEFEYYIGAVDFILNASADLQKQYAMFLSERLLFSHIDPNAEIEEWGFTTDHLSAKAFFMETINAFIWDKNFMAQLSRNANNKLNAA